MRRAVHGVGKPLLELRSIDFWHICTTAPHPHQRGRCGKSRNPGWVTSIFGAISDVLRSIQFPAPFSWKLRDLIPGGRRSDGPKHVSFVVGRHPSHGWAGFGNLGSVLEPSQNSGNRVATLFSGFRRVHNSRGCWILSTISAPSAKSV